MFGVDKTLKNVREFDNFNFWNVYDYIYENKSINDIYLIHPSINNKSVDPELSNFSELFLTKTGASTFVNFSVHPFKDSDIIEWYERIKIAKEIFKNNVIDCYDLEEILLKNKITNIVIKNDINIFNCEKHKRVYLDDDYSVFSINQG